MTDTIKAEQGSHRIYYLDVLRCIACLCVVMIHSSSKFTTCETGSADYWIGLVSNTLVRAGVPLFTMISGALMLDENYECTSEKLLKKILKYICFFLFWSALYCTAEDFILPRIKGVPTSFTYLILQTAKGYYHLWFIYMIIGLYLITPLLRLWVRSANKKYVEYFLLMSFTFSMILPNAVGIGSMFFKSFEYADNILNTLNLKYVGGYTAYYILGWYLHNFGINRRKLLTAAGIASCLFCLSGTYVLSVYTGERTTLLYDTALHAVLYSSFIFVTVKKRFENKNPADVRGSVFVRSVSKHSLGIYAIHASVVAAVRETLFHFGIDNALIVIPVTFITAVSVSYLASVFLKKIPILKKTV